VLKDYVNGVLRYAAAPPGKFGEGFDSTEGQEGAVQKKMDLAKKYAPGEERRPTYVENKVRPNVIVDPSLLPKGAQAKGRKGDASKKEVVKKKRGGKGKHKKDVEFPYGMPPDPHEHK
jgi:hypothetical protein